MKFTHDNSNTAINHYDAITLICKSKQAKENTEVRSVPTFKKPFIKTEICQKKLSCEQFIDLTDDDIDNNKIHGSSTDYNHTSSNDSWSDETYISSDGTSEKSTQPNSEQGKSSGYPYSDTEDITTETSGTDNPETYNIEELSTTTISTIEQQALAQGVSHGRPFPTWIFDNKIPEEVTHIPFDINGLSYYKIDIKDHKWHQPTSDKRYFKVMTSSHDGFLAERRSAYCKGSFVCTNKECPFTRTSKLNQPNKVSWRNIRGIQHYKICAICDETAERISCPARKMIEYDYSTRIALVYHIGYHSCWPQISTDTDQLLSQIQKPAKRKGSAKEVALEEISSFTDSGDMFHVEQEADAWMDRCKVKRTIESIKPSHGADENSFDAVANMKKKTNTKDIYYIYQIGNINYGNTVDHVFKCSHKMAEIALQMDVNGEDNILQLKNAYFDATHSRVQYFKSLGMWLVHPAMKKVLCLASMEIRSEHHKDIALFLHLFNKILEEVSGKEGYKFNPRYFVCDDAGTNYKVIALVYGEEFAAQRIKGCQWHFKSDIQKHLKHVRPEDQDLFLETCFKMCDVTTVADYNRLKGILDDISEDSPEIKPFILYWDPRHSHVFQPFRGAGLPSVNMSEQANKSFKPTSSKAEGSEI